jgi:hypothetical protein
MPSRYLSQPVPCLLERRGTTVGPLRCDALPVRALRRRYQAGQQVGVRLRPLRIGFVLLANPDRKGATMTAPATTAATVVDTDLAAATGATNPRWGPALGLVSRRRSTTMARQTDR